jgi:nucleoid-associated protein YgaU
MAMSCCLALSLPLYAAHTEMTYTQYETELSSAQQREKIAKEQIAQEQARMETLKRQIAEIDLKIAAVKREIYGILGITEADVAAAESEIASIRGELESLLGLLPEDLKKRSKDIDTQQTRITALKKKPVSYLWRVRDLIPPVEQLLEQVRAKASQQIAAPATSQSVNSYTVRLVPGKRECLYRIAAYDFIYNNAAKWPTLYRTNESIIKKKFDRYSKSASQPKYTHPEDLIFPGQVLDIPR